MLFASYTFLFAFLPLVVAGCWSLKRKNARLLFLTAASWTFYAWWDWRYLPILVGSTAFNYAAGIAIERTGEARRRKLLLIGVITANVALLGYFKYANFFLDSLRGLGSAVGLSLDVPALHIVLPIGISFYTFISISYIVDVYRRAIAPARNPLEYSTFVGLFPHQIAGPILRFGDIAERLRRPLPRLTSQDAMMGLFFIGCGLAKKLLLADQLAPSVDRLFAAHGHLGFVAGWAGSLGYALQLYFDFSAYSDIAVGCGWLLGFRYPQNFDSPYKAVSVTDFWRRWHMTLSRWLRDYLFFSLARPFAVGPASRAGARERMGIYSAQFLTMLIAGLWHGAAWTFVAWGAMHGLALASERAFRDFRRRAGLRPPRPSAARKAVHRTLTFAFVVVAFAVFRSSSLGAAGSMLAAMFGLHGFGTLTQLSTFVSTQFAVLLIALLVFVNVAPNTWQIEVRPRIRYGFALGIVTAIAVMSMSKLHTFIYFQF